MVPDVLVFGDIVRRIEASCAARCRRKSRSARDTGVFWRRQGVPDDSG
ncbi:hypothetical protein Daura_09780 [Dactylosporangium aurantiacum]|uniref:Uncharacterized protein n=1 Tax=Dactylosporangium aurantiacum TaxID=35754 RepID=A0A9Q9IKC4_9ACTN|nr:hypothetical protein [Dactylosporangium aurantiacum]MDG6109324.1 hypothetical protein [Dactylosporangium aurantiacum]UWZ56433.1 hypothetical protein Daura_09780 [Dactylosporangium aurantiacum]